MSARYYIIFVATTCSSAINIAKPIVLLKYNQHRTLEHSLNLRIIHVLFREPLIIVPITKIWEKLSGFHSKRTLIVRKSTSSSNAHNLFILSGCHSSTFKITCLKCVLTIILQSISLLCALQIQHSTFGNISILII